MIALDAIFNSVSRVRYNIEKTRVGDNVDLDKLVLTIDTDGSIDPKNAFEQAAAIPRCAIPSFGWQNSHCGRRNPL